MSAPNVKTVYAKARSETAKLLGYGDNIDGLTPEQSTRLDIACALRVALDDQAAKVLRGESADVSKLLSASEALSRLLPAAVLAEPPPVDREDPRAIMLRTYLEMRRRGELANPETTFEGRARLIEELRAEIAALKAKLAGDVPTPDEPDEGAAAAPAPDNVVPLRAAAPVATQPPGWDSIVNGVWKPPGEAAAPQPAPAPVNSDYELAPPEPWRAFLGKPPFI
jgi:hypothetical protein